MITLWGVWRNGEWLRRDEEDGGDLYLYANCEDAHHEWDIANGAEVREYGHFVQVPPEVVEAVKAYAANRGRVTASTLAEENVILNWIAQAVGSDACR